MRVSIIFVVRECWDREVSQILQIAAAHLNQPGVNEHDTRNPCSSCNRSGTLSNRISSAIRSIKGTRPDPAILIQSSFDSECCGIKFQQIDD